MDGMGVRILLLLRQVGTLQDGGAEVDLTQGLGFDMPACLVVGLADASSPADGVAEIPSLPDKDWNEWIDGISIACFRSCDVGGQRWPYLVTCSNQPKGVNREELLE